MGYDYMEAARANANEAEMDALADADEEEAEKIGIALRVCHVCNWEMHNVLNEGNIAFCVNPNCWIDANPKVRLT